MRDETEFWLCLFIVIPAVIVGCCFGFSLGAYVGRERACESVKMEWVKNKCMKVTREEVK